MELIKFQLDSIVDGVRLRDMHPVDLCNKIREIGGTKANIEVFNGENRVASYNCTTRNAYYDMIVPSGSIFTMPKRESEREVWERLNDALFKCETLPNIIELLETNMKDERKFCAQLFIHRAHQLGLELGLEAQEEYGNLQDLQA